MHPVVSGKLGVLGSVWEELGHRGRSHKAFEGVVSVERVAGVFQKGNGLPWSFLTVEQYFYDLQSFNEYIHVYIIPPDI